MMKRLTICFLIVLGSVYNCQSQEISMDDLLNDMSVDEEPVSLLPERMLFTQRAFWGEKGLYRRMGIAPKVLTAESREKELKARRAMFKFHQALGLVAAGGMIAQAFLGTKLYNGGFEIRETHNKVATGTNIVYGTTALLAFTAPPPMVNRKKFDNIKLHKILSAVHLSGMITTNVLGKRASVGKGNKAWHRASAITTFAAYAGAIASIKFEF